MKDLDIVDGISGLAETNKRGLCDYYNISSRTIDNWMSMKIVSGRMVRGELLFHLADCDRQLMDFTVKHDNSTLAMPMRNQPEEITYATKNTLAAHYQVSPRIIGSWRQQGLLSYIKIRNVVRYNVAACDENLCQYPMIN